MADRMRANMPQVWVSAYDTSYPSGDTDPCPGGAPCSRASIAVRDKAVWSTQLSDQLPNATARIACVPTPGVTVTAQDQQNGAPYAGLCTIAIVWNESNLDRDSTGVNTNPVQQTFSWVFQP